MDNDHLRVSDTERQAVVDQLREHTAHGRLTLDEFADRTGEALGAVTRADLQRVLRELPDLAPPAPGPAGPPSRSPRRSGPSIPWSTGLRVAALVAVVGLVVTTPLWWVIFPLFFWTGGFGLFGGCGSRARRSELRGGRVACGPPGPHRSRRDRQGRSGWEPPRAPWATGRDEAADEADRQVTLV